MPDNAADIVKGVGVGAGDTVCRELAVIGDLEDEGHAVILEEPDIDTESVPSTVEERENVCVPDNRGVRVLISRLPVGEPVKEFLLDPDLVLFPDLVDDVVTEEEPVVDAEPLGVHDSETDAVPVLDTGIVFETEVDAVVVFDCDIERECVEQAVEVFDCEILVVPVKEGNVFDTRRDNVL